MPFFKIIASEIGDDAGPFIIRSNTGAILASGVTRQQLLDGFTVNVPIGVTSVNIQNAPTNTTCTGTTTLPIPLEGAWEMEKANVETISDHYGVLFNPYTAPVESFVAEDIVGIYAGVVSGTGTWLIKGTSEDIAGTTYGPGGTLIVTGVNTNTQTTVESGAILQIGYDTDSYTGRTGGTLTVNAGGKVDVVGANESPGRISFGNLTNNGEFNFIGPDRCGEGYFQNSGVINNASTITVKDNAWWRFINSTTFGTQVGFIKVEDGATLEQNNVNTPSTQTLQLNGCGKCNDIGTQDGALLVSGNATIASPIELQSTVCMDHVGSGLATISGRISGNYKLTLNNQADSLTRQGTWSFVSSTAPFFDNTLEIKNTSLYATGANTLSKADIVLLGTSFIQQDSGVINLGSLSSPDTTTGLLLNNNGGVTLKENGSTTYAGLIQNSGGSPWNFTIEGPSTNVIKLTGQNTTLINLRSTNGGRIIFEGTQMTSYAATGGGTISAGSKISARIDTITLTANGAIDVYASGSTTGLLYAPNGLSLAAGWKVNLMEGLPAGTHNIVQKGNTVAVTLPTLGTNLSGRTVTGFANSGNFITVTLA
jgi:hypothetical protein